MMWPNAQLRLARWNFVMGAVNPRRFAWPEKRSAYGSPKIQRCGVCRGGSATCPAAYGLRGEFCHDENPCWAKRAETGFTLLELMIVITIIMILATIGVGHYEKTVLRSHEAVLHNDLRTMRQAIQDYTQDKEAAPNSLDDLVSEHYIDRVPPDPMTGQPDWVTENCDLLLSPDQSSTGICDVHSGSDKVSPFENTAYSSW
jgi:general secretion pathway protein G